MDVISDNPGGAKGVHTVRVAADSSEPLSTHVVEAVAEVTGVDSAELGFELYDAIDADALDTLHRHAWREDGAWQLTFEVADCAVAVSSDGTVSVV